MSTYGDPEIDLIAKVYDVLCEAGLDREDTKRAVAYAVNKYNAEHVDAPVDEAEQPQQQTEG